MSLSISMAIDQRLLDLRNNMNSEQPEALEPAVDTSQLPPLRGSPAQIKWALTIRENTLKLEWPEATRWLLRTIVDSTWWIANKSVVTTLKFKPPTPPQIDTRYGVTPAAPVGLGQRQPNLAGALAGNAERSRERMADTARVNEAAKFAASVSKDPKAAEAAILAVLSKLYRDGRLKDEMRTASRAALAVVDHDNMDERDIDAIERMLT